MESKTAVRKSTEAEASYLRSTRPMPPPGVQTFDLRRLRRRERRSAMLAANRELSHKLAQATVARKALANLVADKDRKLAEFARSLPGRVMSFTRRIFSSRNKG